MAAPQLLFFSSKSCKLCAKLSNDVRKVWIAPGCPGHRDRFLTELCDTAGNGYIVITTLL